MGVDPAWSRLVRAVDAEGIARTWHLLDNGVTPTIGTLLCVHGNPTWSFLWRRFIAQAPPGWRVVAVDQLGMGWSERTTPRTLAQRVDDLGSLTEALGLTGPVVTLAHDWGGPISLGWALEHRDQLRAVVLTNTAVHQPADAAGPALIRLAHTPGVRQSSCVATPTFVRATTALSRPALPREVRDAFAAPYASAFRRQAVGDFVADIPFDPRHPSAPRLDDIAARLSELADVPALLLWGPRDPVFSDVYLRDLRKRMPHADVHRYEGASHLVTEDAPLAATHVWQWLADLADLPEADREADASDPPPTDQSAGEPLWAALSARSNDHATAIVELGAHERRVSFAQLESTVRDLAAGLVGAGVRPGHRVAMLVPPGADLSAAVYACWRVGASVVVADAGLGVRRMGRALRGSAPDHVIGIAKGLLLARAAGVPGQLIAAGPLDRATMALVGAAHSLADLARSGRSTPLPALPSPDGDPEMAVLFTSGATGPPKGVVYRQGQLRAQLAALRTTYRLTTEDRLVAAFAPFALYGPALGLGSAVPDMDVTAPDTLTATALADAVSAVDGTVVFASPAALRNVVATAHDLTPQHRHALAGVRLLMSAGAPVPASLLRAMTEVLPAAEAHTPYGMTECLPVADISLTEIEALGAGDGVCVGHPVAGVTVAVIALDADGRAVGDPAVTAGVTGEVCVRAAHLKDRYDQLWATERASRHSSGWHRTGDAGHLDDDGRLWVEGRLVHVVTGPDGPVTPVGPEQRIEALPQVDTAAVVGVGPAATQQTVVVVVRSGTAPPGEPRDGLAAPDLSAAVRASAGVPVAAVLVARALPVDIRHASKIDRSRVSDWATSVLVGKRAGRP
ncbi:alpha/beta fold hydrolase [Humibacillus sp. DSM 29435]|uniref:alpha/beta fold hydrolase n=1 Tax=Humibacillus sp. DSM 29435 TaxID=1869167 RepID=UPI0020C7B1FF|nr:alpha/beta fold hydrolase [Humibacillus sp. DSM 29435]